MNKHKFKDLIEAPKNREKEFWNRIAIGANTRELPQKQKGDFRNQTTI